MWKELEQFKTGKKIKGKANIVNTGQQIDYMYDEYVCPVGDLIEKFIKHQTKSKFKRKFDHDLVTKKFKDILKECIIRTGL